LATDRGGPLIVDFLTAGGHEVVAREIVPDEPATMAELLSSLGRRTDVDAILMTGGTGIGSRDQTYETVSRLLNKILPGYGELFRMLSFEQVGPAAMLSRAIGGLMSGKILLTMPGSPAAVQLAMERLIVPELGHLVREARK
jgi:molybdopterin adenylyltransferase